jgi:hypothetical protein
MHFEKEDTVSHPARLVLETMIERMEETVPFLPNVERIDLLERRRLRNGRIFIVRRWQGTAENVPRALRPFVSGEWLAWIDSATWVPKEYRVEWRLSTKLGELYDCSGVNYFEPHPNAPAADTRIRITGDLQVHPHRFPGIPRLIGLRLAPAIESFVVGMITPNLTSVAAGLQGYLDQPR